MIGNNLRALAFCVVCSYASVKSASAIIVDAGQPQTSTALRPRRTRNAPTTRQSRFRTRRTVAQDIDSIATMLAGETQETGWMDKLRAKTSFQRQLTHRLAAVEESRRAMQRIREQHDECVLSDYDGCKLMWSQEAVRRKIEKAVSSSRERSGWLSHGYDMTPPPELLNHCLITVEDALSSEVVAFAEVAWLPSPSSNETAILEMQGQSDDTDDEVFSSTIVNLVTSKNHRRLGIASRMLRFLSKFVSSQWSSDVIGLYVQPQNEQAISLYSSRGFVLSGSEDGLLYMTKSASNEMAYQ